MKINPFVINGFLLSGEENPLGVWIASLFFQWWYLLLGCATDVKYLVRCNSFIHWEYILNFVLLYNGIDGNT